MTKKEIKDLAKELLSQMNMTEEEDLLSELAKLMTLMNLYTDKEEYEKCALLKARIKDIKRRLKKIENDEI